MKLYSDSMSTVCRGILLFIAEHQIDIEVNELRLFMGEHQTPEFMAINPNGTVPALVDGDLRLTESSAILKYLADRFGSTAYPATLAERARINAAMDWFNTGFYHWFGYDVVYCRVLPKYALATPGAMEEYTARGYEMASRKLAVLNDHMLAGNAYVCGDTITLADYFGLPLVALGELVDFDLSPWPNVKAWVARMQARPDWPALDVAFQGWKSAVAQAA